MRQEVKKIINILHKKYLIVVEPLIMINIESINMIMLDG